MNDYVRVIKKITKSKQRIQLTVSIRIQQGTKIKVYGANGQELLARGQRYEIGSLTKIFTTSY